ncbi:trehalose-phosphatase [Qipengyuania sp. JC766]|uniref:trehalose-phosphatase n=1 Tax=Qipengyuania sp. JC766 TaxID=3232139 RepID=UPI0034586EE5
MSLFLDFDGTLVPLADTPDGIKVPETLGERLVALAGRQDGRLALVTGRYLDDITGHLSTDGIAMSGSHGAEFHNLPGVEAAPVDPGRSDAALRAVERFAQECEGLLIERKAHGFGLHYRANPDARHRVEALADELAALHDLRIKRGKMVIELTHSTADKGAAVRAIMDAKPFSDGMPVFVGDDVGDEDGFRAAGDLGGFGVLVGEPRETAARYRFDDVSEVHAWLGL